MTPWNGHSVSNPWFPHGPSVVGSATVHGAGGALDPYIVFFVYEPFTGQSPGPAADRNPLSSVLAAGDELS
jgi:hypothetical protein